MNYLDLCTDMTIVADRALNMKLLQGGNSRVSRERKKQEKKLVTVLRRTRICCTHVLVAFGGEPTSLRDKAVWWN